jgi:hypothetical protein
MTFPPLHPSTSPYRREVALATRRAVTLWGEDAVAGLLDCQAGTLKTLLKGERTAPYVLGQAHHIFCLHSFPSREDASRRRAHFVPSRIAVTSGAGSKEKNP